MAQVDNKTPFVFDVLYMIDAKGRHVGVAVLKATYTFNAGGNLAPADEQRPILMADEFLGEPQSSAMRLPSDFVDFKPASEVIVVRPDGDLKHWPVRDRKFKLTLGPISVSGRLDDPWPFGPVRRDASPRKSFAGTYDGDWSKNRMPLLPSDFDPRFNLAAPEKQVSKDYLAGDERVSLTNIYSADGPETIEFALPGRAVIVAGNVRTRYFAQPAILDTVLVWTESPAVTLVWRLSIPTVQKFEDIRNVSGDMVRLHTARQLYPSS